MFNSLNIKVFFLLGLCAVAISFPLSWNSECRETVPNWGKAPGIDAHVWKMSANSLCDKGTIDWHYPWPPQSLEVLWTRPASYGAYKVCLQPDYVSLHFSEIVDLNNNKQIANPGNPVNGEEQPVTAGDSCASSVDGEVKMLFKLSDYLYMTRVSYMIVKS